MPRSKGAAKNVKPSLTVHIRVFESTISLEGLSDTTDVARLETQAENTYNAMHCYGKVNLHQHFQAECILILPACCYSIKACALRTYPMATHNLIRHRRTKSSSASLGFVEQKVTPTCHCSDMSVRFKAFSICPDTKERNACRAPTESRVLLCKEQAAERCNWR